MTAARLLGVEYLTPDELETCRSRRWRDVLGLALFSSVNTPLDACDVPIAHIGTPPLGASSALCEVWRGEGPLTTGRIGLVDYRASRNLVFGCVTLREDPAASTGDDGEALREIATRAYAEVFRCMTTLGFPRAIRIWNYLPEINRAAGGIERYQLFNEARQRAFRTFDRDVRGDVPAACALGSPAGGALVVYFLAGTEQSTAIENPRQVAAYDYPAQYGAFSPTFSRATLVAAGGPALLVSGTGSIVGDRTMHAGDVVAQTRETITNIRALIAEANRVAGAQLFVPERLKYKVYVRRPDDLAAVAAEFSASVHAATPVVFINADICREDLLVEMEAVGCGAEPVRQ
jgi:enamine deaminase RidA (YjgF/YER057c/UK114 family)